MQSFKYIFVAFFAWQCVMANALGLPDVGGVIPDVGEVIPDVGEVIPDVGGDIPDVGEVIPDVGGVIPDVGEVLPDLGEVLPDVPDLGGVLPDVPDLGGVLPDVPDLGGVLPDVPDLGELIPSLPLGSICRRGLVDRGVGTVVTSLCEFDEQEVAGLCYPKCQNGYENIGSNVCRRIGCGELDGAVDIGVSCEKPKAYGRGAGYSDLLTCVRENVLCEKSGLLFYPTCKPGFTPFGCCICSPNCPLDYIDDGAFCRKPSYDRGVGFIRLGCKSDKEYDAGLCYPPCSNNGIGVGPFCWSTCSGMNSFPCGIFCTSTALECAAISLQLTTSAVKIAADIAGLDAYGIIEDIYEAGKKILEPGIC